MSAAAVPGAAYADHIKVSRNAGNKRQVLLVANPDRDSDDEDQHPRASNNLPNQYDGYYNSGPAYRPLPPPANIAAAKEYSHTDSSSTSLDTSSSSNVSSPNADPPPRTPAQTPHVPPLTSDPSAEELNLGPSPNTRQIYAAPPTPLLKQEHLPSTRLPESSYSIQQDSDAAVSPTGSHYLSTSSPADRGNRSVRILATLEDSDNMSIINITQILDNDAIPDRGAAIRELILSKLKVPDDDHHRFSIFRSESWPDTTYGPACSNDDLYQSCAFSADRDMKFIARQDDCYARLPPAPNYEPPPRPSSAYPTANIYSPPPISQTISPHSPRPEQRSATNSSDKAGGSNLGSSHQAHIGVEDSQSSNQSDPYVYIITPGHGTRVVKVTNGLPSPVKARKRNLSSSDVLSEPKEPNVRPTSPVAQRARPSRPSSPPPLPPSLSLTNARPTLVSGRSHTPFTPPPPPPPLPPPSQLSPSVPLQSDQVDDLSTQTTGGLTVSSDETVTAPPYTSWDPLTPKADEHNQVYTQRERSNQFNPQTERPRRHHVPTQRIDIAAADHIRNVPSNRSKTPNGTLLSPNGRYPQRPVTADAPKSPSILDPGDAPIPTRPSTSQGQPQTTPMTPPRSSMASTSNNPPTMKGKIPPHYLKYGVFQPPLRSSKSSGNLKPPGRQTPAAPIPHVPPVPYHNAQAPSHSSRSIAHSPESSTMHLKFGPSNTDYSKGYGHAGSLSRRTGDGTSRSTRRPEPEGVGSLLSPLHGLTGRTLLKRPDLPFAPSGSSSVIRDLHRPEQTTKPTDPRHGPREQRSTGTKNSGLGTNPAKQPKLKIETPIDARLGIDFSDNSWTQTPGDSSTIVPSTNHQRSKSVDYTADINMSTGIPGDEDSNESSGDDSSSSDEQPDLWIKRPSDVNLPLARSNSPEKPRQPQLTVQIGDDSAPTIISGSPGPTPTPRITDITRKFDDRTLQPSTRARSKGSFSEEAPWDAMRPKIEEVYDDLDQFFPMHDLDKPVIDVQSGGTSPTANEPVVQPYNEQRARKNKKKSIRYVAKEKRNHLHRQSLLETPTTAKVRRRSTKLWDSKVEEVTPGEALSSTPDSPSAPPPPVPPLPSKQIFKWVRGAIIGRGSYGKVYLGMNATNGEMIAVKQVEKPKSESDKADRRMQLMVDALKLESNTLKDLDHNNIVQYLGIEETPDVLSIFMEYVSGGSVGACIRKQGRFSPNVVKSFTGQILAGLEYLHSRGILHRDLKADNILVDPQGSCKISDFGISKQTTDADAYNPDDNATQMQGTIYWMAPEVVQSSSGYSAKVDIWSLGCVWQEMCTGERPWKSEYMLQVVYKLGKLQLAPPLPDNCDLPSDATHFREECFVINPRERPNASELRNHPYLRLPPHWAFTGLLE